MKRAASNKLVKSDLDRYKKNKLGANLALLGLVFECLYFMLIYGMKAALESDGVTRTKFCSIDIGISVILTLVILLVSFLSSEGVKGYNKKFCIVLLVLAVVQIAKIFWLPLYGLKANVLNVNYFGLEPGTKGVNQIEFTILLVYLIASAVCFVASAVLSYLRCVQLEKHVKAVESGDIDMDKVLAELDAAEEASVVNEKVEEASVANEQVEAQTEEKEVQ